MARGPALPFDAHQEERAAQAIRGHRDELDALVSALEKEESLERERIAECLGALPARALREVRRASPGGA